MMWGDAESYDISENLVARKETEFRERTLTNLVVPVNLNMFRVDPVGARP